MSNKIITKNLTKTYIAFEKEEGLKGSIKSLFKKKILEKEAVSNFDLEIEEGEFIGLIGQNGAGKTTMINLFMRFYDADAGDIKLDGTSIYSMDRHALRRNYGMVLQDTW